MSKFKQFLIESPHLKSGNYSPSFAKGKKMFLSDGALDHLYETIGQIEITDTIYSVHRLKKGGDKVVRITIPAINYNEEDSNLVISNIEFKSNITLYKLPDNINKDNVFQVNGVYTDEKYRSFGLTSFAYLCLARAGYTVISDTIQYKDGQMLWKKISRQKNQGYAVNILKDGEYVKDESGEIIEYNSKNLPDKDLWSTEGQPSKTNILFVIRMKQ